MFNIFFDCSNLGLTLIQINALSQNERCPHSLDNLRYYNIQVLTEPIYFTNPGSTARTTDIIDNFWWRIDSILGRRKGLECYWTSLQLICTHTRIIEILTSIFFYIIGKSILIVATLHVSLYMNTWPMVIELSLKNKKFV